MKEGNVLFNNALNTFYLRLNGIRHAVKDHTDIYIFIYLLVCFNTHLFTYVCTICVNNPCLNFSVNLCLKKKINNIMFKKLKYI